MISKFLNALYSVLAISCFESIFNNDSTKIISKKGIQILENSTSEEIEEMIKKVDKTISKLNKRKSQLLKHKSK